jgi:SAM-dependent methyltransferase
MTNNRWTNERLPAPPNLPPGDSWSSRGRYRIRIIADLQVASVLTQLKPWLASISGRILEVGCGGQPYSHLIPACCSYECLDSEMAAESFGYRISGVKYYDGGQFPFESSLFDHVFHTEVIEHVYDVATFLTECRRVLKPSGTMFFSVPFQARYHYIPHDFWRFTPASLDRILQQAGFSKIAIVPRGTDITVASYKIVSLVYRWLRGSGMEKMIGIVASPVGLLALVMGHISMRLGLGSIDDTLGFCVFAEV